MVSPYKDFRENDLFHYSFDKEDFSQLSLNSKGRLEQRVSLVFQESAEPPIPPLVKKSEVLPSELPARFSKIAKRMGTLASEELQSLRKQKIDPKRLQFLQQEVRKLETIGRNLQQIDDLLSQTKEDQETVQSHRLLLEKIKENVDQLHSLQEEQVKKAKSAFTKFFDSLKSRPVQLEKAVAEFQHLKGEFFTALSLTEKTQLEKDFSRAYNQAFLAEQAKNVEKGPSAFPWLRETLLLCAGTTDEETALWEKIKPHFKGDGLPLTTPPSAFTNAFQKQLLDQLAEEIAKRHDETLRFPKPQQKEIVAYLLEHLCPFSGEKLRTQAEELSALIDSVEMLKPPTPEKWLEHLRIGVEWIKSYRQRIDRFALDAQLNPPSQHLEIYQEKLLTIHRTPYKNLQKMHTEAYAEKVNRQYCQEKAQEYAKDKMAFRTTIIPCLVKKAGCSFQEAPELIAQAKQKLITYLTTSDELVLVRLEDLEAHIQDKMIQLVVAEYEQLSGKPLAPAALLSELKLQNNLFFHTAAIKERIINHFAAALPFEHFSLAKAFAAEKLHPFFSTLSQTLQESMGTDFLSEEAIREAETALGRTISLKWETLKQEFNPFHAFEKRYSENRVFRHEQGAAGTHAVLGGGVCSATTLMWAAAQREHPSKEVSAIQDFTVTEQTFHKKRTLTLQEAAQSTERFLQASHASHMHTTKGTGGHFPPAILKRFNSTERELINHASDAHQLASALHLLIYEHPEYLKQSEGTLLLWLSAYKDSGEGMNHALGFRIDPVRGHFSLFDVNKGYYRFSSLKSLASALNDLSRLYQVEVQGTHYSLMATQLIPTSSVTD